MKQTSSLTRNLANAQELHHARRAVTFRVYTETKPNLQRLTARYFEAATLLQAIGLWQGVAEQSTIIEVVGAIADLQSVVNLAGDIGYCNAQTVVLITWDSNRLDVPGVPIA